MPQCREFNNNNNKKDLQLFCCRESLNTSLPTFQKPDIPTLHYTVIISAYISDCNCFSNVCACVSVHTVPLSVLCQYAFVCLDGFSCMYTRQSKAKADFFLIDPRSELQPYMWKLLSMPRAWQD